MLLYSSSSHTPTGMETVVFGVPVMIIAAPAGALVISFLVKPLIKDSLFTTYACIPSVSVKSRALSHTIATVPFSPKFISLYSASGSSDLIYPTPAGISSVLSAFTYIIFPFSDEITYTGNSLVLGSYDSFIEPVSMLLHGNVEHELRGTLYVL